ncbi:3-oxoacyl-ACP synthase [Streptomyces sp. SID4928]|uniref:beta-ketoacyl-[acyl-carrier-protein] synthase family protein n=1 Tax=unclassified Streptomyces TaxID=2593676 RepID=UPI0001C1D47F|nr:beta-ketoacyl synthase N-terminal-like domain-containing protein [Streptomyces sp. ACT-1]EGE42840.1 Beta-ketoacyl-acyl-carrier-protein synthase I [Streptomyces sp. ACT-1]MYR50881.1 3-oxoacyl-ACP synthase [Streptomyces sp. SID4928]
MNYPIIGAGAVSSIGGDPDAIFASLCEGRSGLAPLRAFDRSRFNAQRLFEIDDRETEGVDEPGRATRFLVEAVRQAVEDAGLPEDLAGIPVLVGTGLRELRSLELWWRDGVPFEADGLHFEDALRSRFGAVDTHTFAGACSASLYALALAWDLLAAGEAETVVVAGCDVVTESMFGQADRVQFDPPPSVRPFDKDRRGTILGEGAAAVVLSRSAGSRPARGLLRSVAVNCDAHHQTAPDAAGVEAAVRQAHEQAGVTPPEIDLVVMHGTGTPLNDRTEAAVTAEVFDAPGPALTGIKSLTGHTSGSAGLLSLVVALSCLDSGTVPHVAGLSDPLPEGAGLRLVAGEPLVGPVRLAQVNSFGFGGVNAVALVGGAA